ncbi:PREDICTED: uncharacterized protein LOC18602311 [Theobroma cacao]|uniref:Uncharacterized protein LOC18602311 n=1 Tax=Theobroma cacao TaxID=3641 RepID=A0AB32W4E0_THECC|nr:PREDICTED: uncharacterized protein LOC18602311 [Theobroma cacao]XP_017974823.1 PREDICTED: uncharacterized protein LOC18602311 [Theobroma cacao]
MSRSPRKLKFYFVKVWPYQDTSGKFKIQQAEKLIEKLNQQIIPIRDEYYKIQNARSELNHLRIRESHFLNAVYWKETKLDRLKAALDKLNFAKTAAYKRGSTSSSTSSSGECDFHSVGHWMLHGCSNLATEKKLLKQIPGIQHDKIDSSILVASINILTGCMHERKSAIVKQQCRRLKQMVAEISAVNACRN